MAAKRAFPVEHEVEVAVLEAIGWTDLQLDKLMEFEVREVCNLVGRDEEGATKVKAFREKYWQTTFMGREGRIPTLANIRREWPNFLAWYRKNSGRTLTVVRPEARAVRLGPARPDCSLCAGVGSYADWRVLDEFGAPRLVVYCECRRVA